MIYLTAFTFPSEDKELDISCMLESAEKSLIHLKYYHHAAYKKLNLNPSRYYMAITVQVNQRH